MAFSVLIPLDGSATAEAILQQALALRPTEVLLVHVDAGERAQPGSKPPAGYLEEVARRVSAARPSARVAPVRRAGRPAAEILAAAAERGANLIALTTHGRTGFNRLILGSVADEVIHAAHVPVLTQRVELEPASAAAPAPPPADPPAALGPPGAAPAPGGGASGGAGAVADAANDLAGAVDPFVRVLVAYDGSERSFRSVETIALLGGVDRARLFFSTALDVYARPGEVDEPVDPIIERALGIEQARLEASLAEGVQRARNLGFPVEALAVSRGRPADVILRAAEQTAATAIALTSHGRRGPSRWLLGSVAEAVLRASNRPLLLAR